MYFKFAIGQAPNSFLVSLLWFSEPDSEIAKFDPTKMNCLILSIILSIFCINGLFFFFVRGSVQRKRLTSGRFFSLKSVIIKTIRKKL